VRAGPAWAVAVGAAAVGGNVLIRVLDRARAVPHEPQLMARFAAGFADGMVNGWDQDVYLPQAGRPEIGSAQRMPASARPHS